MKIGILTFYQVVNYGAVLQAYALQQVLTKMGHEVAIVNYQPPGLMVPYKRIVFRYLRKPSYLLRLRRRFALFTPFRKFVDAHLLESEKIETAEVFKTNPSKMDLLIVGSDQVWNIKLIDADKSFFFPFDGEKPKKISYAASCGGDYTFLNDLSIIELLKQFQAVSVRERGLKEALNKHTAIDAEVVLDPTLLLDDYTPFITENNFGDYIIVYNVVHNPRFLALLKYVKRRTGLKVINMGPEHIWAADKNLLGVSPAQWVNFIYHARYVYTNSFHGVAFSVKFQKQFLYIPNNIASDDRVIGFLGEIGLANYIIKNPDQIDEVLQNQSLPIPNDNYVKNKRNSLEFLINNIK